MSGPGPSASEPVLELEGVSFAYAPRGKDGGDGRVLRDVSLSLPAGRVTGLVGVNGAGKTTLLELAAGGLAPSEGAIRLPGGRARGPGPRAEVGYCPDVPAFPPFLTADEALGLCAGLAGLSRRGARAARDELAGRLGLEGILDRRVSRLSRGNVVRLGIAQALIGGPRLLLLDESFASLDPVAQRDLREVIREEARRGAAVLVSSHQLGQLEKVADRVLVLRGGEVLGPCDRSRIGSDALEALLAKGDGPRAARTRQVSPPSGGRGGRR